MDIVIVAQYLRDIENFEGNNSRFVYLAKMLCNLGERVEIITSNFNHANKTHFKQTGVLEGITVTTLEEPGYPKNVCLKRFASHKRLAKNISEYLKNRRKPDLVYVAVPSLSVSEECADYCKTNSIRFIVDIQDLWPEAFKMVLNVPIISDIIFSPMKRQSDKVYSIADEIIAVSETYVNRGMQANSKSKNPMVVYLGTERDTFDSYADAGQPNLHIIDSVMKYLNDDKKTVIAYCGTLGASYDINCVLDAIKLMDESQKEKIHFIVMGDGSRRKEFEMNAVDLPCTFTGRLTYPEMVWVLKRCDIAVNPITKGAAQSIINKHMDYAMAGLSVINTQECSEYRKLIDDYGMGYNCKNGDVIDLADRLQKLIENQELRLKMGANARRCAEEKFDRKNSYHEILELFE